MKIVNCVWFCLSVMVASLAQGEPVSVPNTFTPGTPAQASQVNDNFSALAQAIQGMQSTYLYQNGVKVGKARLLNLTKLNSGYLVMPYKKKGSANIYLKDVDKNEFYYSSNNCTGSSLIELSDNINLDLILGDSGLVFAVNDSAYYLSTPANAAVNFYYNSFRKVATGECVNVSEWVYPSVEPCLTQAPGYPPNTRVKQVSDGMGGYTCEWPMWQMPCPLGGDGWDCNIGTLDSAYIVNPNNQGVTGIATVSCINPKGELVVCLPNASLQAE